MSVASANFAKDRRLGQAMSTTKKSSTKNSSWQFVIHNGVWSFQWFQSQVLPDLTSYKLDDRKRREH